MRCGGWVRFAIRSYRGHGKESSGSLSPQDKDFSFDRPLSFDDLILPAKHDANMNFP